MLPLLVALAGAALLVWARPHRAGYWSWWQITGALLLISGGIWLVAVLLHMDPPSP